jgi:hypothetical protein
MQHNIIRSFINKIKCIFCNQNYFFSQINKTVIFVSNNLLVLFQLFKNL